MSGPSTTAVHAGEAPGPEHGAVNQGIVASTTFQYPEMPDGSASPYIYTRWANPTLESVEAKLAALEGAEKALLFASGLGAEMAVFQQFGGDRLAMQVGCYGGTNALVEEELVPRGVIVDRVHTDEEPSFHEDTSMVWMESITNPLLRVADIRAWADAAHDVGAILAVDATFASPMLQRPLEHGADIVVHSATKYLNGHSDVTAGVIACTSDHADALWKTRRNLGATLDPAAAYLLGRGAKTLPLRMEAHCANAAAVAEAAAAHEAVETVHYPGLEAHPDHSVAQRMLAAPGGMLTLDLASLEAAQTFRRSVRIITPAASLGGVESLTCLPLETSHAYASKEARAAEGITDGLVRISIGIEDPRDLVADVLQALDSTRNN